MTDEVRYREALKAMESGDKSAMTTVAFYELSGRGDAEIDEDDAVALLEERVKDGDSEAMWILGLCYEYGMGTEQNIKRANRLYLRSSMAQNEAGLFLSEESRERGSDVMEINKSLCNSLHSTMNHC